jgi:hypothetical protein
MSSTRTILSNATTKDTTFSIPTIPDSLVTLHELCNNCQSFTDSWDVLDKIQDASSLRDWTWQTILLCTVAHLKQGHVECHLCTFLLASLKSFPNRDLEIQCNANVYLRALQSEGCIVVQVFVGTGAPVERDDTRPATAFLLKAIHRE